MLAARTNGIKYAVQRTAQSHCEFWNFMGKAQTTNKHKMLHKVNLNGLKQSFDENRTIEILSA